MIAFFLICYVVFCVIFVLILEKRNKKKQMKMKQTEENRLIESGYVRPQFKKLTQEQIDDIHARGKITPEEKFKEWNDMDLCAPGDAIGSAAWRCKKFHNCHDCLIDYANSQDEYISFFSLFE